LAGRKYRGIHRGSATPYPVENARSVTRTPSAIRYFDEAQR
jgi:hypothetical protein